MKPIFKINQSLKLPKEIRTTILDKFSEILQMNYVLLHWIDTDKLDWNNLTSNQNIIAILKDKIN